MKKTSKEISLLSLCSMDISIIIPVYNEQDKIVNDIDAASKFLIDNNIKGEIIVVDDGSTDTTSDIVGSTEVNSQVSLKLIKLDVHTGKGGAVQAGMMEAAGDTVMFIDSGNCVPYSDILKGLDLLAGKECQITHGSRFHKNSKIVRPMKPSRKLTSFLFRKFIRLFVPVPGELKDTQCGLKIYNGTAARELYSECITDGFMFDVEIILRACKRNYKIMEFPIEWSSDPDSRLSASGSLFRIFREIRNIRKALKS